SLVCCSAERESKSHDFSRGDRRRCKGVYCIARCASARESDSLGLGRIPFAVKWCAVTQARPPVGHAAPARSELPGNAQIASAARAESWRGLPGGGAASNALVQRPSDVSGHEGGVGPQKSAGERSAHSPREIFVILRWFGTFLHSRACSSTLLHALAIDFAEAAQT